MILSGEPATAARWWRSAAVVTALHALVVGAFFVHVLPPTKDDISMAVAVEMAPLATAPPAPKADDRPTKKMVEAPKAPPEKTPPAKKLPFEMPPEVKIAAVDPAVVVPKKSDEPPAPAKPLPPAPDTSQEASPNTTPDKKVAAPVTGGAAAGRPTAADQWKNQVLARIGLRKRYPAEANNLGQEDSVEVFIAIDRSGRLISSKIEASKGFPLLDRAALEAVQRASPYPKPPAEIEGDPIQKHVSVEFLQRSIRHHHD